MKLRRSSNYNNNNSNNNDIHNINSFLTIYVIRQTEKLCLKSWVPSEASGRGRKSRQTNVS